MSRPTEKYTGKARKSWLELRGAGERPQTTRRDRKIMAFPSAALRGRRKPGFLGGCSLGLGRDFPLGILIRDLSLGHFCLWLHPSLASGLCVRALRRPLRQTFASELCVRAFALRLFASGLSSELCSRALHQAFASEVCIRASLQRCRNTERSSRAFRGRHFKPYCPRNAR
jgi:hypothetical protein